jgi:hypothetical protein
LFCRQHFEAEQTNSWYLTNTIPKMLELSLKWRHECYKLRTPKYPARFYSFKETHEIPGTFWDFYVWWLKVTAAHMARTRMTKWLLTRVSYVMETLLSATAVFLSILHVVS